MSDALHVSLEKYNVVVETRTFRITINSDCKLRDSLTTAPSGRAPGSRGHWRRDAARDYTSGLTQTEQSNSIRAASTHHHNNFLP